MSNSRGLVQTRKKGMQNIPDQLVCSTDDGESKRINADEKKSKRVIANACYSEESESKSVQISVNTSKVKDENNESFNTRKVKYTNNETKYE